MRLELPAWNRQHAALLAQIRAKLADVGHLDTLALSQLYQIELAVRLRGRRRARSDGGAVRARACLWLILPICLGAQPGLYDWYIHFAAAARLHKPLTAAHGPHQAARFERRV